MIPWAVFCLLILSAVPLSPLPWAHRFIVWNVGQGLWTTRVDFDRCVHFDTGGERWPRTQLTRVCRGKPHIAYLSHADTDHMNGLELLERQPSRTCLVAVPSHPRMSRRKRAFLEGFPPCPPQFDSRIREVHWSERGRSSNAQSRVLIFDDFLLPGDSPTSEEKKWAPQLRGPIKTWILGHHGSKTSSSDSLFNRMRGVRMAIASAREERYRHPHPSVVEKLKAHRVGLLRTEIWGHLVFEIEPQPISKDRL